MNRAALLQALRDAVGHGHVLTRDTHDLAAWERDWRQRAHGHALAVVFAIIFMVGKLLWERFIK